MIKDGIKLHSCKGWSLDNEVANAIRHIKLYCFSSVLKGMTDGIKNGKDMHYLLTIISSYKKPDVNRYSSFCCIAHQNFASEGRMARR